MAETSDKIKWHPAFLAAAELEFRENLEELEFDAEHNLSKEPIRVDLLILRKIGRGRILNEIGHIMRRYNIVEYKGPGDLMTIDTLYKAIGYASLYKAYGEHVDAILADEITISIFQWSYPAKLMAQLSDKGCQIEEKYPGIYYIFGSASESLLFPIQIVVMKQLGQKNHSSLRILTTKADIKDIRRFLSEAELLQGKRERSNIDAVLQASVRANEAVYEEVRSEQYMCEALKELMKDEFEKERQIAITEGREQGRQEGRQEGRLFGVYDTLKGLVQDGILTVSQAAERADVSEDEFKAMMQK